MATHSRRLLDIDSPVSIRAQWARQHAIYGVRDEWNKIVRLAYGHRPDDENFDAPELIKGDDLPTAPLHDPQKQFEVSDDTLTINVGIIGAGAAGLFSAVMLEYINSQVTSVKFTYDILEADTTKRSGGRLYTYQFSDPPVPHDYYDVGAMRFPDHAIMTRVFSLFTKLGMDKSPLNPNGDDPPLGSLIEYFMQNIDPTSNLPQEPWRFNSVNQWGGYSNIAIFKGDDPWQFNTDQSLNIRPDLLALKLSPGDIMTALLEPVRKQLRADIANNTNNGWNTLMGFDGMTMTQFLSSPWPDSLDKPILPPPLVGFVPLPPYNYDTIQWFETFNGGTNWYDQAFSEIVLESLDFDFPPPGTKPDVTWYCILGGAQQLATKMEATVNQLSGNPNKVQYSSQVTALTQVDAMSVNVDINGGAGNGGTTNPYNCVFNTTTLGCLEHMDTTSTSLNSATRSAMRSLGYGPSCKVAIKFTHAWWIYDLPPENAIKRGGLGHSDLNIRTCVYPSYNIYDKKTTTAVLLCTYTWQQDAERLGSLMGGDETQLKTLLIADLVRLHSGGSMTPDQLFAIINGSYISHFAWDWYKAPNAAGAFAFFRPFQFSEMWGKMIIPAGDVVVMGEHASPHHAWVVGALESAVHGLAAWCSMTKTNNEKYAGAMQDVLNVLMPENPDPTNPYVGLPLYMDINTARWHGLLAGFARQEMLEGRAEGVNRLSLEETAEAKRKRAAAYLEKLGVRG